MPIVAVAPVPPASTYGRYGETTTVPYNTQDMKPVFSARNQLQDDFLDGREGEWKRQAMRPWVNLGEVFPKRPVSLYVVYVPDVLDVLYLLYVLYVLYVLPSFCTN